MHPAAPPRRIIAPTTAPVTLAAARDRLRLAGVTERDAEVTRLIEAATALLDGPGGLLGIALEAQTWTAAWRAPPGVLALPVGPVVSVTAISWRDGAGVTQVVPPAAYILDQAAEVIGPVETWPDTGGADLTVTWVAGTGATPAEGAAIEAIVLYWYDGGFGLPPGLLDQLPRRRISI